MFDKDIAQIERRLGFWHRSNDASRRIGAIPGVGLLSATAAVAAMGDPKAFKSGREFAAWLGLVPRHVGTGGRVQMLGISKRGDRHTLDFLYAVIVIELSRPTSVLSGDSIVVVSAADDADSSAGWPVR